MTRRQFVAIAASAAPIVGASIAASAEDQVRVEVQTSTNPPRSVANARVFVLSASGKEVASAHTDQFGKATLPAINEADRPEYVLVEHPAYFISGLRWSPGLLEYFVLATILTVR
jgi:hypothetical protein